MPSLIAEVGRWVYGRAHLLLALNMLFWAGNMVMGRYIAGHVPPVALAWMRWTCALAVLLPLAWPHLRRDLPAIRRDLPILLVLSATGVAAYNTMAYVGLQYTQAINGTLLQSTAPLLIAMWSFVLFRDRLRPAQVAGILLSLAGVVVIVTRGDWRTLDTLTANAGDLWILGALVSYALYSTLLRKRPAIHWLSFLAASFLLGSAILTPFLLWEMSTGYVLRFDALTLAAVAYASMIASLLAYVFFNRGVELIGANQAGPFFHLIPAYGAVLSVVLLGERVAAFHVIGIAAILCGVALATRQGPLRIFRRRRPDSS